MNAEPIDPHVFENLIHLLEISVVVGIGVIVYITKKYSPDINQRMEEILKKQWTLDEDHPLSQSSARTIEDNSTHQPSNLGEQKQATGRDTGDR